MRAKQCSELEGPSFRIASHPPFRLPHFLSTWRSREQPLPERQLGALRAAQRSHQSGSHAPRLRRSPCAAQSPRSPDERQMLSSRYPHESRTARRLTEVSYLVPIF